jgi:hypothetical protein
MGEGYGKTSRDWELERRCGRHVLVGATAQWTKPCMKVGTHAVIRTSVYADIWANGVVCRWHANPIKAGRGSTGEDFKRGMVKLVPIADVSDERLQQVVNHGYVEEEE